MTKEGSNLRDLARRWSKNKSIKPGVYNCLMTIADRIDAEMMELPRDRDGSPIHVGDTVYLDDGRTAKVTRIGIGMDEDSIYTILYGDDFSLTPGYVTHTQPDSWERIADELEAWCDGTDVDGDACGKPRDLAKHLAKRIRKLAEREDGR